MGTKSIFDQFAAQIDASVQEFNSRREGQGLRCERTLNRIAVYKEHSPRVTLELEFDEAVGTVRMRRQKLEAVITDLQLTVDRTNPAGLHHADYCRLAQQALHPLMQAFA
jgi:hypothetical protein